MVFGYVKQSGGHVKIYSEANEGTSVKIYLPRAVGIELGTAQRSGAPAELPTGSATVLVVEDEADVREIAVIILRSLGYRVLEAPDGDAALRVFGAHAPEIDLLLTDIVMPGRIRGRELAEQMTAMRPDIKVLFMSGYTENAVVHHGRLDDGVQLLGKPFKREQLARKVAEVLRLRPPPAAEVPDGNVVDLQAHKREG
jgi:CheY-like chemotaxis protein